jgi:hypothetical protein
MSRPMESKAIMRIAAGYYLLPVAPGRRYGGATGACRVVQ